MRSTSRLRPLALVPLLAAAACSDGYGGPGPDALTPAEVAGVYLVCELRFQPTQTALPAADLLARVIDPAPPQPRPAPSLSLDGAQPRYDLVYTRRGDAFLRQLQGSVTFGESAVNVRVYSGDDAPAIATESLLPPTLGLQFQDAPKRLATSGGTPYQVRRADYARAAGISEDGLQDRISGTLTATLRTGSCA